MSSGSVWTFASTFDSYQPITNGQVLGASNTELGNLTFSLKQLIARGDNAALSAGLSLELPTADDIEFENDAFYIRRSSESVHLAPFVGGLWTPTPRTFIQTFGQLSFDTNGEEVVVQDKYFGGVGTGRLQDATTLFADLSGGYWFYRNLQAARASQISGVAGILEMHFNQTVQDTDFLNTTVGGNSFRFGQPGGSLGVANLTVGSTIELGMKSTVTAAYVTPLTDRDRQFNSEFQVMFNYFFDGRGSPFRVPSTGRAR